MASSPEEVVELFSRYRVAVADANVDAQSADGRYVDAYAAGFLLAKVVIRSSGYRIRGGENHRDTLLAVVWLMGSQVQSSIDALDAARKRRNATMYDAAGLVDEDDVAALLRRIVLLACTSHPRRSCQTPLPCCRRRLIGGVEEGSS